MARSELFAKVARSLRIAFMANANRWTTAQAMEHVQQMEEVSHSRRRFLAHAGAIAVAGAASSVLGFTRVASAVAPADDLYPEYAEPKAPVSPTNPDTVAIIGGGLAGLACAEQLIANGVDAVIYDANDRVGGRCWSLRNFFPGQVAERGGELIDTAHKQMIAYARRFNLTLEDVNKKAGETFYYFDNKLIPEVKVVEEFRAFVATMRKDLIRLSPQITADTNNAYDRQLDNTTLADYLNGANALKLVAGPIARKAIIAAYEAEYGLVASKQSCLNFVLFIHADRRSKFAPFAGSDERYRIVEGNDGVTEGIAKSLPEGVLQLGAKLTAIKKDSAGQLVLSLSQGGKSITRTHRAAVLAIPFTTLRHVTLDASLQIPAWKKLAINTLGYGTNAKMMVGFTARPWAKVGSSGASYSDLANPQATWETNRANSTANRAILTDYSSGPRGAAVKDAQIETPKFLNDLEKIYPGVKAAAAKTNGKYLAHLEPWPSNPLTKGSYTCYLPGQFTTIAGNEAKPIDNLFFAGEHADSFYNFQGFMEGAIQSGVNAAAAILKLAKKN